LNNTQKIIEKLDDALEIAEKEGMSTSEVIGILFYYAHNLAQEARDIGLRKDQNK
jgi:hypothetical protein